MTPGKLSVSPVQVRMDLNYRKLELLRSSVQSLPRIALRLFGLIKIERLMASVCNARNCSARGIKTRRYKILKNGNYSGKIGASSFLYLHNSLYIQFFLSFMKQKIKNHVIQSKFIFYLCILLE
jgi:hypothetical protein